MHHGYAFAAALALALAGAWCAGAMAAGSSASSLALTFVGGHVPDPTSPAGYSHAGTFTASGAFCASGRMRTTETTGTNPADTKMVRLLTCDDGSGTATAVVFPAQSEHGGSGSWQLVGGTGAYEKLRGHGRFTSVATGGDPSNEFTIDFRSTWSGVADLDDTAPAVAIATAGAVKLRAPTGAYSIRLALALHDDVGGNPVSYTLRVTAGSVELARRFGTARTATLPLNVRIRPSPRAKSVRLLLSAEDPVGNQSTTSRVLRLPR